jgi:adenylate cyclase
MSTYRLHEGGGAALLIARHHERMALLPLNDEPAASRRAVVKQFFVEVKRRKVYRVAVAYIVVAWVLTQVATQVFPFFEVPNWTVRLVVLGLVLGFPLVALLAWIYDVTPAGIKRTEDLLSASGTTRKGVQAATTLVPEKSTADLPFETFIGNGAAILEGRPSIAVLPFSNMSGDPEQDYFGDGITEDLITDLSKVSGLFVIARHNAFTYKAQPMNGQQIGAELGVAFILEGSVRKAGSKVRITAQLIRSRDGGHFWGERFDRELTDIFAIQDEITHAIVEQLKVKLLPQEKELIAQAPTGNVEAYTYYLKGRQFLLRGHKSYYELARRMFSKAVDLDPLYARAYAGIANCDIFISLQTNTPVPTDGILATSARAIELDDQLAEAHASLGFALALAQRYPEAVKEFDKATALDPNSFEAYYFYGRAAFAQGEEEKAAGLFQRAAEIKPDDYQSLCLLVPIYKSLGREEESLMAARQGLERAERQLSLELDNPRPVYLGASALLTIGENARAREWTARALAIDPDDILVQYNVACTYSRLGDREQALDLLERSLPRTGPEWSRWIRHDSDLDSLRTHPRFQKILELTQ